MKFDKAIFTRFLQVYGSLVIFMALFFGVAGRLDVPRAWLCFGLYFLYLLFNSVVMFKYAPEVIRQRSKIQPGVKWWDNVIMVVYGLATFLIPAAAGLDAGRGVPSFGIEVAAIGAVLFVGSSLFITWAIVANRFFVNTVVVQKKQKVVSTGPYAIVRHPGYLGMLFMYGTMPLIIGSAYALVPFGILALALITRTYLEDKTLQKELPGYTAYAKKVQFRLLPSIW